MCVYLTLVPSWCLDALMSVLFRLPKMTICICVVFATRLSVANVLTLYLPTQIIQLLEAMGLKQYESTFMRERITGEILVECDDDVLAQDLNVTSRLHRVRLMKIVSGRHSAESILRGEDPYVYATKET